RRLRSTRRSSRASSSPRSSTTSFPLCRPRPDAGVAPSRAGAMLGTLVVLRYALLGLLAARPMSGYELAKLFDGELQALWTAKHSQIYPELARLLDERLIRQSSSGPRRRKTYAITAAGRAALRAWLLETEPDRSYRHEAILRVLFIWLLDPADAEAYLRRE